MAKLLQQHISRMRLAAASAALTLVLLLVLGIATTPSVQAQTFTMLHSFDGTDGAYPYAGLVQGTNGNFYGTTSGLNTSANSISPGTVFKITPSGTLTTLYSFCSQSGCADGDHPLAGLIQATNGDLYGTTGYGGANDTCQYNGNVGCGTVFKITPSGTLTTLHSFNGTDGWLPFAGLVQATDGNFYGTTDEGGANACPPPFNGCGTVFKITPSGTLTTLHSFNGGDGSEPLGGLVQATNGDLYGTTESGGANGDGTVFKIILGGTLTTLYSFCSQSGCTDGAYPCMGVLIQATDGNLYGTTLGGGANGAGTVFKITPSGTLTTLYSFCSQSDCTDGVGPLEGLVRATDGNFYGTTGYGGAFNDNCPPSNTCGTIFKITPSATLTTLYNFCSQSGCADGWLPFAELVQATNGKFYGTTLYGGANNYGTVFSLSVGLGPFVETLPSYGKVGTAVKILGTNLTGATSVTFNGTGAQFTVVSKSEIKTTVPTGATTGPVEVTTPKGTLKSNVVFRVKK